MLDRQHLCDRRAALKALSAAALLPFARRDPDAGQAEPYYPHFWQESSRPEFVWRNYEDGRFHRKPKVLPMKIGLRNFSSERLQYRLFDLVSKKQCCEANLRDGQATIELGSTDRDFLLLVSETS